MPLRPALAIAATVLLWGSAFAAIRAALEHFSAGHLSVLRLLVATAVLAAIAVARGVRLPAARDVPAIAAVGFAGMTAYQVLLNSGERTVPAGTASLLVNLSPVFTAIGASLWLAEDMTRRRWAGVAIACGGATLIAVAGDGGVSFGHGALLVLGAAVVQAAFFLGQQAAAAPLRQPGGDDLGDGARGADDAAAGAGVAGGRGLCRRRWSRCCSSAPGRARSGSSRGRTRARGSTCRSRRRACTPCPSSRSGSGGCGWVRSRRVSPWAAVAWRWREWRSPRGERRASRGRVRPPLDSELASLSDANSEPVAG